MMMFLLPMTLLALGARAVQWPVHTAPHPAGPTFREDVPCPCVGLEPESDTCVGCGGTGIVGIEIPVERLHALHHSLRAACKGFEDFRAENPEYGVSPGPMYGQCMYINSVANAFLNSGMVVPGGLCFNTELVRIRQQVGDGFIEHYVLRTPAGNILDFQGAVRKFSEGQYREMAKAGLMPQPNATTTPRLYGNHYDPAGTNVFGTRIFVGFVSSEGWADSRRMA